jgi:hypothetical protein
MTIYILYCRYLNGVDVIGRYLEREHAEAERYCMVQHQGYDTDMLWIETETD